MAGGRRGCPRSVSTKCPSLAPVTPVCTESFCPETEPIVLGHLKPRIIPRQPLTQKVALFLKFRFRVLSPNWWTQMKVLRSLLFLLSLSMGLNATVLRNLRLNPKPFTGKMLCFVLCWGLTPPFEVMKGFLQRIWASYDIDKILYVRKVESRGFFFFDKKPLLVKGWTPSMELQTEAISSLPLWIQLPPPDIKYWGMESLSKIGSLLVIPIKTDRFTKDKLVL
ncbi:hypothetical protein Cgig2_015850 [Carnegiea gigantea]|uniref:DUF4283 domain-containing protein n=1 Tax=Carnegiea gigantea TaxID=171969 RepID=A0A9Q1GTX9_9CARY|nr:hypothetical protein Cgig2_015850 [Carnegiea gigantea]